MSHLTVDKGAFGKISSVDGIKDHINEYIASVAQFFFQGSGHAIVLDSTTCATSKALVNVGVKPFHIHVPNRWMGANGWTSEASAIHNAGFDGLNMTVAEYLQYLYQGTVPRRLDTGIPQKKAGETDDLYRQRLTKHKGRGGRAWREMLNLVYLDYMNCFVSENNTNKNDLDDIFQHSHPRKPMFLFVTSTATMCGTTDSAIAVIRKTGRKILETVQNHGHTIVPLQRFRYYRHKGIRKVGTKGSMVMVFFSYAVNVDEKTLAVWNNRFQNYTKSKGDPKETGRCLFVSRREGAPIPYCAMRPGKCKKGSRKQNTLCKNASNLLDRAIRDRQRRVLYNGVPANIGSIDVEITEDLKYTGHLLYELIFDDGHTEWVSKTDFTMVTISFAPKGVYCPGPPGASGRKCIIVKSRSGASLRVSLANKNGTTRRNAAWSSETIQKENEAEFIVFRSVRYYARYPLSTKKVRRCGLCGDEGHDRRTCKYCPTCAPGSKKERGHGGAHKK